MRHRHQFRCELGIVQVGIVLGTTLALSATARAQEKGLVLFPNAPQLALFASPTAEEDQAAVTSEEIFVHPLTGPYFHEDAFVSTDFRLWYLYQHFARNSPVGGGEAQIIAGELRVALTPQLQFMANKDGWTHLHTGLIKTDGFNDVDAGLKYEFIQDWKDQFFLAAGGQYQFPFGESRVLNNKEEARAFVCIDKGFDKLHLGGTFNYFWSVGGATGPFNTSDHLSAHVHADYYLCKFLSPVVEANFYHVTRNRPGGPPFQGADITNLGDGKGDDIVTVAAGFEIRPVDHIALRAAWEKNVDNRSDIFDSRVSLSAVFSF